MKIRRISATVATLAAGALVLSACTPPSDESSTATGDDTSAEEGGAESITIGWNQQFYEYNANTATGNATANSIVLYFMNSGFNYYDADLNLVKDDWFGDYEVVSEDPLQVKYTINDGVTWSDGTPVSVADMVLYWGALSGNFNTFSDDQVEYDEEGNITNQDEIDQNVYFNFVSPSVGLIEDFPEIDGNSITFTYTKPFGDWETNLGIGVPAHVVAMHALEIDDAEEATQALLDAFENNDTEALAKISKFYNEGFQFGDTLPEDSSLYLSSGAYLLTDYDLASQYLTLTRNPDYTGPHAGPVETITFRYSEDPMAQVQALQNGELNVISPQSTTDVVQAIEAIGDSVGYVTGVEGTYEHIDLAFDNGGPFDPATYGGDKETALKVRQAFLHLIPRNEIIEKIVQPLNPDAEVRNSYTVTPGSPMYDAITAANGMSEQYADVDVDAAAALLEEAGVTTAPDVRILFAKSNARRQQEFELIQATVNDSGLFNVIDASSDQWGSLLSDTSQYDAAVFGWQSTSTAVTESDANYRTGGGNNFYGYSNEEVDALFDQLQVATEADEQEQILADIEKHLVDDAFGLTLSQFPSVTAWTSNISGIDPIAINPTVFWNFWEWTVAAQ